MQKAIIVDLDSTLANIKHRLHYIMGEHKEWKEFHETALWDKVNEWCRNMIEVYARTGGYKIIICTGRPEKYKYPTISWMLQRGVYPPDEIFMRKDGDYRQDALIKKEIYETQIKDNYDVLFVLEDRKQCVDMWRSLGLVCLQCAEGDY